MKRSTFFADDETIKHIGHMEAELTALRDANKDLQSWFDNLKVDYDKLQKELQALRDDARSLACVNACEGIPTYQLFVEDEKPNKLGEVIDAMRVLRDPTPFGYVRGYTTKHLKTSTYTVINSEQQDTDDIALYAAPVPASEGWMPIESAPKDGTIICLGSAATDDFPAISTSGRWNSSENDGVDYMGQDSGFIDTEYNYYHCGRSFGNPERQYKGYQPTHWMPLSAAPKE